MWAPRRPASARQPPERGRQWRRSRSESRPSWECPPVCAWPCRNYSATALRDEGPHHNGRTSLAPFLAFPLVSGSGETSLKSVKSKRLGGLLMSKRMIAAVAATAVAAGLAMTPAASAQEVKVGVILPFTGVGAELAQQIDRGMELYLKLNADQVKPYTITLVKRDSKAPDGAAAKIAAQELLTQDKVDVLAGWVYSPDAIASAPVVNAGKKLAVIMNAAA